MGMWNQIKKMATDSLGWALGSQDLVPVRGGAAAAGMIEPKNVFTPAVDLLEGRGELLVVANVPGAARDDTSVSLDGGVLILRARVRHRAEGALLLAEFPPGGWYRRLELPGGFAGGKAQARLRGGVLTVSIPRADTKTRPRSIPVRGQI